MLEIKTKDEINISKVGAYIIKNNLKGTIIKENKIFIPHKIKKEILQELMNIVDIVEISSVTNICTYDKETINWKEEYLYPQVERGEIYICDFGENVDNEQYGERYAIVVQNDQGNEFSPTTIVIPCTTQKKKGLPVHHEFKLLEENMEISDYMVSRKTNTALAECIKSISKKRLIRRIGKMSDEFMKENIDPIIKCSLGLD